MNNELEKFIEDNINIIELDTKESWKNVYTKLSSTMFIGEFTDMMLSINVDPAEKLGYIPIYYLHGSKITSYEIPSNVTVLDDYAFTESTLKEIVIPNGITTMGYGAFYRCEDLQKVNYKGTIEDWVEIYFQDEDSNPIHWASTLYINDVLVTQATITRATEISNNAFCNCESLTSVVIGNSVTNIEEGAFSWCKNLTSVLISNSVTCIDSYAFYECSKLIEIKYDGTKDAWAQKVHLEKNWNRDSSISKIICTDGVIEL